MCAALTMNFNDIGVCLLARRGVSGCGPGGVHVCSAHNEF